MGDLPLPIAALALRARNAKSAKERHDLAYFAWEATVRLAVAVRPVDPKRLAMPSTGDWIAALGTEERILDDARLLAAQALFSEEGLGRQQAPKTTTIARVLEGLPGYRNAIIGHGGVRSAEFYERAGETLVTALPAFVSAVWPDDARLVYVESVELAPTGERTARLLDLSGSAARVVDPRGSYVADGALPRRLYQQCGSDLRPLHPWLVFEAAELRERVLFFNGRGRSARYLDYVGGEQVKGKDLAGLCSTIETDLDSTLVARSDEAEPPKDPTLFGDYKILGKLGEGGMGEVYLARQQSMERLVALKMLPAGSADDPVAIARFDREIAALARCEHPNVIKVLASGNIDGKRYYAMEVIDGADLAEVASGLRTGSDVDTAITTASDRVRKAKQEAFENLPHVERPAVPHRGDRMRAIVEMFRDAARALDHLHVNGIVHRDVKPANLMVTAGDHRIVIMDLGLAALGDASRSITKDKSSILGTLRYLPPEQLQRSLLQVDRRADIYSLGATFYELLVGRPFLDGDSEPRLIEQVLREKPPDAHVANPSVPRDLAVILAKATDKNPAQRYDTAESLARDLDALLAGRPITARPPTLGYILRLTIRRHRGVAVTIAAALLLAIAGVAWFLAREHALRLDADRERARAEASRADSEALLGFMLNDLREQLASVGRLDLLDTVTRRAVEYYDSHAADAPPAKRASALRIRAAVLEAQGNLGAAVDSVHKAVEILRATPNGQVELHADLRKLSELLHKQGDLPGALAAARDALELAEKLAAAAPNDGERQRDVAAARKKIGDVARAQGDLDGALAAYRAALAIRDKIAREAPTNLVLQRDLAIAHERVSEVLRERNELVAALEELRAGLAIADKLAAADHGSEASARDLAVFHTRIGDVELAQHDVPDAIAAYREALAIDEDQARQHASAVMWQRDLSIAHANVGHALAASGDRAGALTEFRADLSIAEQLAALDPTNTEWQRDVSVSHETIGDALLEAGDAAGALAAYRASLPIAQRIADQDETNPQLRRDLADTYDKLGKAYAAVGDARQANDARARAVALRERK